MAWDFQQPAPLNLQKQNTLPQSIDALFNQYQANRQINSQLATADQARQTDQANFRLGNFGLSPQDVNQAMPQALQSIQSTLQPQQPQQPQYNIPPLLARPDSAYASPAGAPPGGGPIMSNQQQPQGQPELAEDPKVTALKQIMALHMQSAQLGFQGQQAGIQKTQAEAAKAGAEAGLTQAQIDMLGGTGAVIDNYVNQIRTKKMSYEDLGKLGRGDIANTIRTGVSNRLAALGIPVTQLGNELGAQASGLRAQSDVQYGTGQKVGALAGTLEDVLNQAEPLVSKLNNSQLKLVNDAWNRGLASVNDKQANQLLAYMNEARGLYASVLANGGAAQEADKEMANESIGRGLNPNAYAGMKEAVAFAANSKVKRLTGAGYNEPPPNSPSQTREVQLKDAKGNVRTAIYNGNKFSGWKQ